MGDGSLSNGFTGGTVTGATRFTNGLTANTISATTYYNLPSSTFTGGTVTGPTNFTNGLTATTISATTYLNIPSSIFSGGTVTGPTNFTNGLTATTISATTYYNLPSATFSGGTVNGSTNFTNGLTANTISATTYYNLPTDIRTTGTTYANNTFTYTNNTGGTYSVLFNTVTGLTVNGNLTVTGNTSVQALTANTIFIGDYQVQSLNTTTKVTLSAGTNTIYSIPTSAYTGSFFDYTIIGSSGARAGNIMSIWSGTTARYTEVSTNDIGITDGVTFSVSVLGNYAILSSSATTSGWILKTIIRSI